MASNPPIDAVPLHLRTSNPQDHILRFLDGQAPFIPEFIVKGREHIDRCLQRDAKREQAKKERDEADETGMRQEGSEGWTGSSRTSGIVKRMRKKDGSCPGSSDSPTGSKRGKTRSGPVVVVLKRSEVEQGYGKVKPDRMPSMEERDKENRPPAKNKDKMDKMTETRMLDKMLGITIDRSSTAQTKKKDDVTKSTTTSKKKPIDREEVDVVSMTSSAERRHDRKMRRRVKAAIRHTPSKPLYSDPDDKGDKDDEEEEDDVHAVTLRPSNSTNQPSKQKPSKPDLPGMNESQGTRRNRKHSIGLTLMANFKSDSLRGNGRLTLQAGTAGGAGGGARMVRERGFLGGKVLRSGGGYKVGVYKGGQGKRVSDGMKGNERETNPPSPPRSKMRRPDESPRDETAGRNTSDQGGRRRSARLSQASSVPVQQERPVPVPSPSWPETRTGSSPGQARAKEQSVTRDVGPDTRGRSGPAGSQDKAEATMTTTRSSSGFKSVFHVRTDTPVNLDRISGSRSRSSLRLRGQVGDDDEVLLRQALRPLRGGLGNVRKEKNWFKPPKVRAEVDLNEVCQVKSIGETRWTGVADTRRIERDDVQDDLVATHLMDGGYRGHFDLELPMGVYDLELGGQAGAGMWWDKQQGDAGLMDLDEVELAELGCRDYDDQQDERDMGWNPDEVDHPIEEYGGGGDDDGFMDLVAMDQMEDEAMDEVIDVFGTRVRDLEKEMYGGLGARWRR